MVRSMMQLTFILLLNFTCVALLYYNNFTQQLLEEPAQGEAKGYSAFIWKGIHKDLRKGFLISLILRKITAAGKDPVTTVPAAISILLLINEKKYQHNFIIRYCHPGLSKGLTMYITKQPKHYNKNHNTSKTAASPFPSGIAGN